MKTSTELQNLLRRIDHKGYPAYKDTKGQYQFPAYVLSIDHVQGDPFAAPSKVSVRIKGQTAGFDVCFYDRPWKRIALQDYLLRRVAEQIREFSFKAKGSGKSGLLSVVQPGQEILERSGCVLNPEDGSVVLRMEVGFPANGRTINAGELEKIFFEFLPVCIKKTLFAKAHEKANLERVMHLSEDQHFIREQLPQMGLSAFVANGAILPRKSGISMLPMKGAVPFQSPKSLEVAFMLPFGGVCRGMGIRKGVTLIVGGGYHGKSTLLKALELGVYDHIAGDGREYVITDATAMKLRAEDGRSIQNTDISMFIQNLPNGKDTVHFYTEDASGSTSQAANTVEAMEAGATLFLIDEDTSATNFMIRDELMQRVVHRDQEPIIPFIDRVRELYEKKDISTILVAGSCGSYFHKADCVIQMNRYMPEEITVQAKEAAKEFPIRSEAPAPMTTPAFLRVVKAEKKGREDERVKTKVFGVESFSINREEVDLRLVEQLVENGQLSMIVQMMLTLKKQYFNGKCTLSQAVEQLWNRIEKDGFSSCCAGQMPGNLVMPRKQELYAALNRCREYIRCEKPMER